MAPPGAAACLQRSTSAWYSRAPCFFHASPVRSGANRFAGPAEHQMGGGISALALTKAEAPTMLFSPMTAPSIITALMPTSALRPITQPGRICRGRYGPPLPPPHPGRGSHGHAVILNTGAVFDHDAPRSRRAGWRWGPNIDPLPRITSPINTAVGECNSPPHHRRQSINLIYRHATSFMRPATAKALIIERTRHRELPPTELTFSLTNASAPGLTR